MTTAQAIAIEQCARSGCANTILTGATPKQLSCLKKRVAIRSQIAKDHAAKGKAAVKTIARRLGVSKNTVKNVLDEMIEGGQIDPTPYAAERGQGHAEGVEDRPKIFGTAEIEDELLSRCSPKAISKAHQLHKRAERDKRRAKARSIEARALKSLSGEQPWTLTDNQDIVECRAVLTDPPYGSNYKHDWQPKASELEAFTRTWLEQWNECGADFIVSFWGDALYFEAYKWFVESLTNYSFVQPLMVHYRNNAVDVGPLRFRQNHELAYFFRRKGCKRPLKFRLRSSYIATKPQTNFPADQMRHHPCQQPVSVYRDWLIPALTDVGDLIADPFSGSGTSGVAACQTNRRWHGIETSPEFLKVAKGRLATYGSK